MCTCGIDIATQQATPAMQSSACAVRGVRPNGRAARRRGVRAARRRRRRDAAAGARMSKRERRHRRRSRRCPMPM